jgi:hypothetical protein
VKLLVLVELLLLVGGLPALDRGAGESLREKLEELLVLPLMLLIFVDKIFGVPSMISSKVGCPSRSRSGEEEFPNIYINVFPSSSRQRSDENKGKDKRTNRNLTS